MGERTETTRTVEGDGVTVEKTIEDGGRVTLSVASDRETELRVQLADPALEPRSEADVEFRSGDGGWNAGEAAFEWTFGPRESRTVRYRVPGVDPGSLDAEPRLSVTERAGLGGIVDRTRSDALRGFIGGERDSLALGPEAETGGAAAGADPDTTNRAVSEGGSPVGSEAESEAEVEIESEPEAEPESEAEPEAKSEPEAEPKSESEAEPESEPEADLRPAADTDAGETPDGDPDEGPEPGSVSEPRGVARALLRELREDRVDEEVTAALRSELGVETRRSQEVRIDHLQNEVADLAAYGDTIEAFIDRYGTFEAVVEDLHDDLSALEERAERTDSRLAELSEALEAVDGIDEELRELRSEVESELGDVRETQAAIESRFDRLDEERADVEDRLADLELFSERITEALRAPGGSGGEDEGEDKNEE